MKKVGRPRLSRAEKVSATVRASEDAVRLKAEMERIGFSQNSLARMSGVSQSRVNEFCNGKRLMSREDLRAFVRCGISSDIVLGGAGDGSGSSGAATLRSQMRLIARSVQNANAALSRAVALTADAGAVA